MNDFPPEILENIFNNISIPLNLRLVCKQWSNILLIKKVAFHINLNEKFNDRYIIPAKYVHFQINDNNNINMDLLKYPKYGDLTQLYKLSYDVNIPFYLYTEQYFIKFVYLIGGRQYNLNIENFVINLNIPYSLTDLFVSIKIDYIK